MAIQEQKTETTSIFQTAAILIGMLTACDDDSRFYAVLASAVLLTIIGVAQRTFMKLRMAKGDHDHEEILAEIQNPSNVLETIPNPAERVSDPIERASE